MEFWNFLMEISGETQRRAIYSIILLIIHIIIIISTDFIIIFLQILYICINR